MRISDWSSDVCSSDLHFHVGEFFRSEILNRGEHRRKSRGIEPTATIAASCGDVSEDFGCHLIVQSQSPGGRMGLYLTLHARARSASIIAYPRCTIRASGAAPREVIPSVEKHSIESKAEIGRTNVGNQ